MTNRMSGGTVEFVKRLLRDLKNGEIGTSYMVFDLLTVAIVVLLLVAVLTERLLF